MGIYGDVTYVYHSALFITCDPYGTHHCHLYREPILHPLPPLQLFKGLVLDLVLIDLTFLLNCNVFFSLSLTTIILIGLSRYNKVVKMMYVLCFNVLTPSMKQSLNSSSVSREHGFGLGRECIFHVTVVCFLCAAILNELLQRENRVLHFWTLKKRRLDQCQQYLVFERSAKQVSV